MFPDVIPASLTAWQANDKPDKPVARWQGFSESWQRGQAVEWKAQLEAMKASWPRVTGQMTHDDSWSWFLDMFDEFDDFLGLMEWC